LCRSGRKAATADSARHDFVGRNALMASRVCVVQHAVVRSKAEWRWNDSFFPRGRSRPGAKSHHPRASGSVLVSHVGNGPWGGLTNHTAGRTATNNKGTFHRGESYNRDSMAVASKIHCRGNNASMGLRLLVRPRRDHRWPACSIKDVGYAGQMMCRAADGYTCKHGRENSCQLGDASTVTRFDTRRAKDLLQGPGPPTTCCLKRSTGQRSLRRPAKT